MNSRFPERASRCESAIISYRDDSLDDNLIHLLADAMHWCDYTGHDFHFILAQACRHYVHELNDCQDDERRLRP